MEVTFSQEIYFSNKKKLPIGDVAKSLLALESVSRNSPIALSKLFRGTNVQQIDIFVDTIESGSLKEKINYYFRIAVQKNLENALGFEFPSIEKFSPETRKKVIAWALVALFFFGVKAASNKVFPDQPKKHINNEINIVLAAGRDITGVDEDKLREIFEEITKENPEIVKSSVEFVKPAKQDPSASISFDKDYKLSDSAIKEIPSSLPEDESNEKAIEFEETEILIRATDKDSGRKGWGAIIPQFNNKRIRMSVAPHIDLQLLAQHEIIVGDVTVFYSINKNGDVKRPHAHLYHIEIQD